MPTRITKKIINEDAGEVCPPGFKMGVKTRRGRHCYKLEKIPKTFDMSMMLGALNEETIVVESDDLDDIMSSFQKMNMVGGRTRKMKNRSRKNKRKTVV